MGLRTEARHEASLTLCNFSIAVLLEDLFRLLRAIFIHSQREGSISVLVPSEREGCYLINTRLRYKDRLDGVVVKTAASSAGGLEFDTSPRQTFDKISFGPPAG